MDNINEIIDSNTYTPKSIAWKLLFDDDITTLSSAIFAYDPDDYEDKYDGDQDSYSFEILITIFMEMIFNSAILMGSSEDGNVESFEPDLSKFNINDFLPLIKDKLKKINVLANIIEYTSKECDKHILNKRYCRIILKHDKTTKHFFISNDITENYHMILNKDFTKKKSLKDIYAIVSLNNHIYQIYFDKINIV